MDKELTKIIYQGSLDEFIYYINNRLLENAFRNEKNIINERIRQFYKDLTRRVNNPAYIEMLLCDLYGVVYLPYEDTDE